MLVVPRPLVEVIWARPGMAANCCSSGVATEEAIVFGSAPGSEAETEIVGKSTVGIDDTGSSGYDAAPKIRMPIISRDVAMGRRMKVAEIFIVYRGIET